MLETESGEKSLEMTEKSYAVDALRISRSIRDIEGRLDKPSRNRITYTRGLSNASHWDTRFCVELKAESG